MLTRRATLTLLAALPFAGQADAQSPLAVVATTGMIADAARRIGGDRVAVQGLMGPGVDPHSYRQTRTDIRALAGADLVLWHGLYLEAQMEQLFLDLGARQPVVAVAESLPKDRLIAHDTYAGRFDPHVWMDPGLWAPVTAEVGRALISLDPGSEAQILAGAEAYLAELAHLDEYARDVLASVPASRRILVTAHDAFGYFGRAYNFRVEGIQGISTDSEAGLARIAELVDLLVAEEIPAVFVESSVSDRAVRALIEGAVAAGHEVAIGGTLYSDAMGAEGTYEGTYLGMIDHNVTVISRALGGSAPETGRLGRLSA